MDQDALVEALQAQTIRAAALDVTYPEPLPRSEGFKLSISLKNKYLLSIVTQTSRRKQILPLFFVLFVVVVVVVVL